MVHEAFGLDDITVRHADRMAAAGYLTLAVDLFSDGGARRCLVATMRALSAGEGRAFTDLAAARDWLRESGRTTGKIGVIGFCMGGGFALLLANDGFDAAAVNYGRRPKDPEEALAGACPIVANFGGKDRTLPGEAAKLAAVLDGLGVENDVKEFPHAGHAFLNDVETGPAGAAAAHAGHGHRPGSGIGPGSLAADRGPLRQASEPQLESQQGPFLVLKRPCRDLLG